MAGEITTTTYVDVPKLAREVIADIGFTDAKMGFDAKTCGILNAIQTQSPDIAMGVDTGGAGDQGLMFGYACDETPELMPLPIMMAHKLVRQQSDIRRDRQAHLPASRRQEPGQRRVRGRQAQAHRRGGAFDPARRRRHHRTASRRREEVHHRSDRPRQHGGFAAPSITSIRPAASSSADRTATPA